MDYVGRTVAKSFKGYGRKKFKGTVKEVLEEDGVQYFVIEYEDGDTEELELCELQPILQPQLQHEGKKAGKPAAAAAPAAASTGQQNKRKAPQQQDTAAGSGKRAASNLAVTEQLQGMVGEVAAWSRDLGAHVARYPANGLAAGMPQCSRVVRCGGMCYTSDIRPLVTGQPLDDRAAPAEASAEYERQTQDVLGQLEEVLQEAGSTRGHLVAVTALLRDLPAGQRGFSLAWNRWADQHALPALSVQESYLGAAPEVLVSVSAVAAVPRLDA